MAVHLENSQRESEAETGSEEPVASSATREPDRTAPLRGAVRGLVASMAMSGLREVTTGLGWLERTPPDEIVKDEAPGLVRSLSEGHERVVVQLAHWGYGTVAGFAYGLLPTSVRRSRLAGPGYGAATWLAYELVVAPALGVQVAERRTVMSRLMLVGDHLLYGLVVADQVAPEETEATTPQ